MNPTCVRTITRSILLLTVFLFISGCSTAYYATMEKFGKEKRHILKSNVEDVRESQTKGQREFKDALAKIKALYAFNGGDLETVYDKLKDSYEDCESRANQIEKRVNDVEQVGTDLFKEWESEIAQMNDAKLKSSSKKSLEDSKTKYRKLQTVMNNSTKSMYPVLAKLKDNVLYLKHNLNAKAVGALGGEVISIEKDVEKLITDMETSIDEADAFIKQF